MDNYGFTAAVRPRSASFDGIIQRESDSYSDWKLNPLVRSSDDQLLGNIVGYKEVTQKIHERKITCFAQTIGMYMLQANKDVIERLSDLILSNFDCGNESLFNHRKKYVLCCALMHCLIRQKGYRYTDVQYAKNCIQLAAQLMQKYSYIKESKRAEFTMMLLPILIRLLAPEMDKRFSIVESQQFRLGYDRYDGTRCDRVDLDVFFNGKMLDFLKKEPEFSEALTMVVPLESTGKLYDFNALYVCCLRLYKFEVSRQLPRILVADFIQLYKDTVEEVNKVRDDACHVAVSALGDSRQSIDTGFIYKITYQGYVWEGTYEWMMEHAGFIIQVILGKELHNELIGNKKFHEENTQEIIDINQVIQKMREIMKSNYEVFLKQ